MPERKRLFDHSRPHVGDLVMYDLGTHPTMVGFGTVIHVLRNMAEIAIRMPKSDLVTYRTLSASDLQVVLESRENNHK